jgi:prepilin-type N-terminal cleavage/methylation domain-containing protein
VKTLRNKNKAGFTLIELLVVIAIIGLLASVVLLALNGARAKSRDAKRIADIRQLASAFELYFNDANSYPTAITSGPLSTTVDTGTGIKLHPTYIGIIPTEPTPADGPCASLGANSNQYWFFANTVAGQGLTSAYNISFCLGAQTGGYGPGAHDLTQAGIQ